MGGGIMRNIAKATAGGALSSLLGKASRSQSSSFVPSIEHGHGVPILHAGNTRSETPAMFVAAHCSEWELDDWELTGSEEQIPAPRMVFGPVPTFEEAKEATTDLKDAMEKLYFSPLHALDSHEGSQETAYGESSTISNVPIHAAKMFSLLRESSEAQMVVASLASDKNLWDAFMKNEKVIQLFQNTLPVPPEAHEFFEESASESNTNIPPAAESQEETSEGSSFMNFLNIVKNKVSHFVGNISEFVQDFLATLRDSKGTGIDADDNHANTSLKAVFMALAVSVILVVLFKRV